MKKSKYFKKMNIHLDLAVEAHDLLRGETGREVAGVIMDKEELGPTAVTTITITN